MTPWRRYWLHLLIASLALLGAGSGLLDDPSNGRIVFWYVCLFAALYNGVLFGVGWQKERAGFRAQQE